MHFPRPPKRYGWLFALIALLATTAQIALAFAPLAEAREGQLVAHVEADGARGHFSHDDATCAACQARSIHGTAPRDETPAVDGTDQVSLVVSPARRVASAGVHALAHPRAPPSVI